MQTLEVSKVRLTRIGGGVRNVHPRLHFTLPDGKEMAMEVGETTATEFERLVVRATPMEKL